MHSAVAPWRSSCTTLPLAFKTPPLDSGTEAGLAKQSNFWGLGEDLVSNNELRLENCAFQLCHGGSINWKDLSSKVVASEIVPFFWHLEMFDKPCGAPTSE